MRTLLLAAAILLASPALAALTPPASAQRAADARILWLARNWEELTPEERRRILEARERFKNLPEKEKKKLVERWKQLPEEERARYRVERDPPRRR
ncbi:MAG: hypothetical protein KatS3mg124_1333 [Porticoccaceae bacterium]|nr:MAG: hypothetical protein KatS3mg124_1333 [Porticoccaceae bacterium]